MTEDELADAIVHKLVDVLTGSLTEYAVYEFRTNPKRFEQLKIAVLEISALSIARPAIRNAALEEAAEVADAECAENEADDRLDNHMRAETADHIADKIRALKSKEPSHD